MNRRYARFAGFVLVYHVFVILTGAFVRATNSGAGCGNHWPSCNGRVVPHAPQIETIIEFGHRLSTGLALPLVLLLVVWGFRAYPRRSPVRRAAVLSLVFILIEAWIGAFLVRRELVVDNASLGRAIVVALHLSNTYLLLMWLTLTAWWSRDRRPLAFQRRGALPWLLGVGAVGLIVVGMFGAITALGDTLFPAESLAAGVRQDLDPSSHFLIRLRIWHPVVAIGVSLYLVITAAVLPVVGQERTGKRLSQLLVALILVQLTAGGINVILRAPVWMQLVHLLLADAMWIVFVILAATTLAVPAAPPRVVTEQPLRHLDGPTPATSRPPLPQEK